MTDWWVDDQRLRRTRHAAPHDRDLTPDQWRQLCATPDTTATCWQLARHALADAQHAGDPLLAAAILHGTANWLVRHHRLWTQVRPPIGVRHARKRAPRQDAA